MLKCTVKGMTLIELITTMTILGVLTTLAIPSFRSLQARQTLLITEKEIQSALYRTQQLAIAPSQLSSESSYEVVGYGLLFQPATSTTVRFPAENGCSVTLPAVRDFVALVKFIRLKSGNATIRAILNSTDPNNQNCPLQAQDYPQDIFMLPPKIKFHPDKSTSVPVTTLPWLIPVPLQATGERFGELTVPDYDNPLVSLQSEAELVLKHSGVRVGNRFLCRAVDFTRSPSGVTLQTRIVDQCP